MSSGSAITSVVSQAYLAHRHPWGVTLGIAVALTSLFAFSHSRAGDEIDRFPTVLINVLADDVKDVAHLVDVVTYYTTFAPFEAVNGVSQLEADKASFRFDERTAPLIEQAAIHDIRVAVTPPLLAHPSAVELGTPLFVGDGRVACGKLYVNPDVVPGCEIAEIPDCDGIGVDSACIVVPRSFNEVTPAYIDYWANKLPNFFDAIDAFDTTERVWAVYGLEEIRPWGGPEYVAQWRLREAMNANAKFADMALMSYSPSNRSPEQLIWTLLAKPGTSGSGLEFEFIHDPEQPVIFGVEWDPPECGIVGDACSAVGFEPYYPRVQAVELTDAGKPVRLQDHLLRSSFWSSTLGPRGHVNRIAAVYRMDAQREVIQSLERALAELDVAWPQQLALHTPDLYMCSIGAANMTAAQARHDFWAGLHRGQGILLYNYNFVRQAKSGQFNTICPIQPSPEQVLDVWNEYEQGLELIKSGLRSYLITGEEPQMLPVALNGVDPVLVLPGEDYLIDNSVPGLDWTFAMPDYPSVTASLHRIDDSAVIIMTQSYAQEVALSVAVPSTICALEVLHGSAIETNHGAHQLQDTMEGIDARVYKVWLDDTGRCPLFTDGFEP